MSTRLDRSLGDPENGSLGHGDIPPFFDDLQANLVRAHGRDFSVFARVRFANGDANAAQWTRDLCDGTALGVPLTSAREQHEQSARRKAALAAGAQPQQEPVLSLWLTHAGCTRVGIVAPPHAPFVEGMAARGAAFGDSAGAAWDGDAGALDAIVLIASDDAADLARLTDLLVASAADRVAVDAIEHCAVRRNAATLRVEPFGYVDGVSDPDFWGTREPETAANPHAPLELILVREGDAERFGSFVAVRKLMQDVDGWNHAIEVLTAQRTHGSATAAEVALTGAMIVGRFHDGTPIVTHGTPTGAADPENDFTYDADPFGTKCPAFAHVRKTNPRGGSRFETLEEERAHRIARRGMPLVDGEGGARGLMFVCLQSDLARQFELIQRAWAGAPDFPFSGTGRDVMVGRRGTGGLPDQDRRWPSRWGTGGGMRIPFAEFVQLAGGAYLYAPSLAALREIAVGP